MSEDVPRRFQMVSGMQACPFGGRAPKDQVGTGMLSDIWETPQVMRAILDRHLQANGPSSINLPSLSKPLPTSHRFAGKTALDVMAACRAPDGSFKSNITIIGCGTSYHVALLAEYLIEGIARIPAEVYCASEYRHKKLLHREGDVLIVISSSGETLDTLESLRNLKQSSVGANVMTIAVVNNVDSSIARESDACLDILAGAEVGIASTKVFSAMALDCVLMAIALAEKCDTLAKTEQDQLLSYLRELPNQVQNVLEKEAGPLKPKSESDESPARSLFIGECALWDIGCHYVLSNNFIFLGRGFNFPIALEGAMKCKEIAYIHAEGYPAAEMKHGPIALIDQFMPVVCIAPQSDACYGKIKANIEETKARSGCVIAITEDSNNELEELCEHVIKVPTTHEFLMPLIAVIPMQLLSFMMGVLRGNEVDAPRGLSKSVCGVSGAEGRGGY